MPTIRALLKRRARLYPSKPPMVPLSHPGLAHLPRWRVQRDALLMADVRVITLRGLGCVIIQDQTP